MDERDNNRRREVLIYLDILDRDTGQPVGRLGDLSSDGLMILSSAPIACGKTLALSIQTPEHLELGCKEIAVDVETRWCRPDSNPRILSTGCRFVGLDETQREQLLKLSQQIGLD